MIGESMTCTAMLKSGVMIGTVLTNPKWKSIPSVAKRVISKSLAAAAIPRKSITCGQLTGWEPYLMINTG